MIELLAFALSLVGFSALALAMHRHHQQVWGHGLSYKARLSLRLIGVVGLGSSFAVCFGGFGWASAPVLWLGLLSVAGLAIVLLLAYRPRLIAFLVPAVLVLAVVTGGYTVTTIGVSDRNGAAVSHSRSANGFSFVHVSQTHMYTR